MANDQALDTLQIDIQASGVSAAEGIQKLADAVRQLRSAVGKDGSKLNNLSRALSAINTAVGQTNYGKIMSVAASLSRLANSLNMVHGASAQSFQNVVKRIEKLEGTVTKSSDSVEKLKESLGDAFSGGGTNNRTSETFQDIAESAKEANKAVSNVAEKIRAGAFTMPGIGDASRRANGYASSRRSLDAQRAKELRAIESQRAKEESQRAREEAASARVYSDATNAAQQQAAQIAATASRVFSTIKKAAGESIRATIRLVENIGRAFMKVGKIAGTVFLTPLKAVGNRLRTLYRQVTGFVRAIGRIALYRAIRSAIKAVTQGLQEGIQNLYQWSLLMDHTFANSMDSIATSMQYLHNGFAAMFSPLIEYAAPILEEITNKVVDFFNIVQQVFATLTGQTTWHKAIRVQKQYGDQIAETGQAAEKAMHQLMAFDELNVINSPSAGGSGGSGQQTPDYSSMFTTEEVNTELTSWVQDIMAFFESGQWTRLGSYIGEKLNNIVNQWNAFADGFNFGLKIRHALQALNGFLETFNFYDLGSKVGDWLAGFVNGIDPQELQKAIVNILNAAVSGASGLIDAINRHNIPAKIGQALGAAFANFNWEGLANLARKILTGVVAIVNSASQSFIENGGPQKLVSAAQDIGEAIGEAFAKVNWANVTEILTSIFTGLVSMFSAAISSFVEMGGPAKLKSALATIGTAIGEAFASIRGKDLAAIINAISTGLLEMFKNGITAFSKNGLSELGEFVKELDWKTVFTITGLVATLKFGTPIIKGLTKYAVEKAIMKHLVEKYVGSAAGSAAAASGAASAAGAAAGTGTALSWVAAGAGLGLTLAITTGLVLKLAGVEMPWEEWTTEVRGRVSEWFDNAFSDVTEWLTGGKYYLGDDGKYHRRDEPERYTAPATQGAYYAPSQSAGGGSNGGNKLARFYAYLPVQLDAMGMVLQDISDDIADIPASATGGLAQTGGLNLPVKISSQMQGGFLKPIQDELAGVIGSIDSSALPSKLGTLGTKAADALKNGLKNANVPKAFDDEATVSATKFGTHDFSPGGLHAGEGIKAGVDRADLGGKMASVREGMLSKLREGDYEGNGKNIMDRTGSGMDKTNLPQKMATVAASMIHSMRWAGWEGAFDQIGAVSGDHYKAAFKSHAQATLMLQSAGGKPITQSYIVPYAKGGFPDQGSLFMAGEVAGQTELMGTINGRTGVASGREITGISDAVYATGNEEAALLRQTNVLLQALLAKDPFGTPNSNAGRWISQSTQAYKAVTG